MAIKRVFLTKHVEKQLPKIPIHVVRKLMSWIGAVERYGLEETRKIPGYHDESLKGIRAGQRSFRLSRSYRGIYVIIDHDLGNFIRVEEVSKHEY